ncbi:CRISPR system precrRNA processing endoribonuclease RAMP protein Cas6 [Leptolyngbya sp. Cla-17]
MCRLLNLNWYHFAFFAGVGRKTSMGMGHVVLEQRE